MAPSSIMFTGDTTPLFLLSEGYRGVQKKSRAADGERADWEAEEGTTRTNN